jgi:hypothetical protein
VVLDMKEHAERDGVSQAVPDSARRGMYHGAVVMNRPYREERGEALTDGHYHQVIYGCLARPNPGDCHQWQVRGEFCQYPSPLTQARPSQGGAMQAQRKARPEPDRPPGGAPRSHCLDIVFGKTVPMMPQWFHWTACIEPNINGLNANSTHSITRRGRPRA